MSFDAFMTRAVTEELSELIVGARVEKVLQPSKDEVFLLLHRDSRHFRLQLNASPSAPCFGLTSEAPENPQTPPVFCMLLRKHITGARVTSVSQLFFERAVKISFETYDEMGFLTERHIVCEIMGRCSNIILCEGEFKLDSQPEIKGAKIIACARPVDFTTSSKRQLLSGMNYEAPPSQDKRDPFSVSSDEFREITTSIDPEAPFEETAAKLLLNTFSGFSPLLAKELAHRANTASETHTAKLEALKNAFETTINAANSRKFIPTLITDASGSPIEFSCFDVTCYQSSALVSHHSSFFELTDAFFAKRERLAREKSRAAETAHLLSNAEVRLQKKLKAQKKELADAEKGENYRKQADLITSNIYMLKRGDAEVTLIDYSDYREDGSYGEVKITLDPRLTPSQFAQKLYKKYAKSKNAKQHLAEQLELGEAELKYIRSVTDALSRINGQSDLDEIRAELTQSGYIKSSSNSANSHSGNKKPKRPLPTRPPKKLITQTGGFTVLVGRNNIENDRLTFRTAAKTDLWFHVKNVPGSHTVMLLNGETPNEADIIEAAQIAAQNSSLAGEDKVTVDYTQIKYVKKPSGAKPGFVIYTTYKQLIVSGK